MTECNIIRDLMPLYEDNAASESSTRLVCRHLKVCPECRKYFAQMKKNYRASSYDTQYDCNFLEIARRMKRFRLLSVGTGAIILAAAVGYSISRMIKD